MLKGWGFVNKTVLSLTF